LQKNTLKISSAYVSFTEFPADASKRDQQSLDAIKAKVCKQRQKLEVTFKPRPSTFRASSCLQIFLTKETYENKSTGKHCAAKKS